jgi:hypothetical protein
MLALKQKLWLFFKYDSCNLQTWCNDVWLHRMTWYKFNSFPLSLKHCYYIFEDRAKPRLQMLDLVEGLKYYLIKNETYGYNYGSGLVTIWNLPRVNKYWKYVSSKLRRLTLVLRCNNLLCIIDLVMIIMVRYNHNIIIESVDSGWSEYVAAVNRIMESSKIY